MGTAPDPGDRSRLGGGGAADRLVPQQPPASPAFAQHGWSSDREEVKRRTYEGEREKGSGRESVGFVVLGSREGGCQE